MQNRKIVFLNSFEQINIKIKIVFKITTNDTTLGVWGKDKITQDQEGRASLLVEWLREFWCLGYEGFCNKALWAQVSHSPIWTATCKHLICHLYQE